MGGGEPGSEGEGGGEPGSEGVGGGEPGSEMEGGGEPGSESEVGGEPGSEMEGGGEPGSESEVGGDSREPGSDIEGNGEPESEMKAGGEPGSREGEDGSSSGRGNVAVRSCRAALLRRCRQSVVRGIGAVLSRRYRRSCLFSRWAIAHVRGNTSVGRYPGFHDRQLAKRRTAGKLPSAGSFCKDHLELDQSRSCRMHFDRSQSRIILLGSFGIGPITFVPRAL